MGAVLRERPHPAGNQRDIFRKKIIGNTPHGRAGSHCDRESKETTMPAAIRGASAQQKFTTNYFLHDPAFDPGNRQPRPTHPPEGNPG
jgi:hypothetical protein